MTSRKLKLKHSYIQNNFYAHIRTCGDVAPHIYLMPLSLTAGVRKALSADPETGSQQCNRVHTHTTVVAATIVAWAPKFSKQTRSIIEKHTPTKKTRSIIEKHTPTKKKA